MLVLTIILFAAAAILGLVIITAILKNKATPKPVVALHGLFAATALILLIVFAVNNPAGLLTASIILFIAAALGGFILLVRDIKGKPGPKALAGIHAAAAVIAFLVLLFAAFSV